MPIVNGVFVAPTDVLAKYGLSTDETMQVPLSFDFAPFGTFGKWYSRDLFRVGTQNEEIKETDPKPLHVNVSSSGYIDALYGSLADAQAAIKAIGEGYVNHWIRLQTEKKYSYALPQPENWSDPLVYNVKDVATLRSSRRHTYNFVFLPSLVHAAAVLFGYDVPEMSAFNELLASDTIFDDELSYAMIGHPDASVGDDNHWSQSKLWKQRAELWAALGEPDPRRSYLLGSGAREKEITSSEELSNALYFAYTPWRGTFAKLVNLPDPGLNARRADADDESRASRYSITMVDTIYGSDEEMRAAAEEQASRSEGREGTAEGTPFTPDWSMPSSWSGISEDEFKAAIAEELSSGKPQAMVAKNLEITTEELKAAVARYELG